jgi:hypothetical protein
LPFYDPCEREEYPYNQLIYWSRHEGNLVIESNPEYLRCDLSEEENHHE